MDKEQITKILSKIKDIIMCSKDGELLLEYVEQLEQQCKKQKEIINKAINNIVKETKSMPTNGCKIRLIEILDILKEVSK